MQSAAGNHAVASLVTQRLDAGPVQSGCVAPPVEPTPADPQKDPQWAHAKHEIETKADATKAHPPASKEVGEAQNAAVAPPDDKEAQAKAAHTVKMDAAKPGGFDKAGFIAAVKAAIAAKAPKNLDEADKFAQSGKADQVKNEVMSKVTGGKQASAREIKDTTEATPDTSAAKDKPVTPLQAPPSPPTPPPPDPKLLAPKPAPEEQTRLGAESCATDHKMAEAGVTEEQLAKSNEPEFTGALEAKKTAEEHDANAPTAVRHKEAQVIAGATADADATAKTGLGAMTASKGSALQAAGAGKQATKSADEGERTRITGEIKKIFDKAKTDVEGILTGLDKTVSERFEEGERKAKEAFVADHQARMAAYRAKRYGGPGGSALWLKDLLLDMPPEANALFLESKKLYESRMEDVIGGIADLVGSELARAKARVSEGRAQVQKFVAEQPKNLQKLAGDAAKEIGSQFEDLEKSVDEKHESLVDDLADKYIEARNAVDEEIKKLQAENKGLAGQAAEAIGGAIETVKKLKDMLLGVFTRAANAVEKIIKDPMDFLGKFVNAVKTGIQNFMSNILTHLKKGLQGWLFGTLAEAGIEIPEKFDLKGIIGLLLSLLGLTWTSIRTRIVNVVGEKAMSAIEKGVDFVQTILTEDVPGLWKFIAQKISDLKEQVMGRIRDFVITKVIMAGVTWLISLLNPAAAFIKACKMIYDAVMWFVDNAQRLKDFVDSVLDSVESIAAGGVGKVAALIEATLSKTVPMLISGLASLLGLGGIADKIKSILEKVQTPVGKAVDWLIAKAVKYGKKFLDRLKKSKLGKAAAGVKAKAKAAYAKGKAWVKKKYEAGKAWVKKKYEGAKAWVKGKIYDDSPEGKQKRLDKGLADGVTAANKYAGKPVGESILRPSLGFIKLKHGLQVLEPVREGENWAIHAEVQRAKRTSDAKVDKTVPVGTPFTAAPKCTVDEYGRAKSASASLVYSPNKVDSPRGSLLGKGSWLISEMHAGHLIPHSFGGKYEPGNLVPITKSTNKMFTAVEGTVRKAFRRKTDAKADYDAHCEYNKSGPSDLEEWITSTYPLGKKAQPDGIGDAIFSMIANEKIPIAQTVAKRLDIPYAAFNYDKLKKQMARTFFATRFTISVKGHGEPGGSFDNVI
ncbi:DNA/RNA non-specific endonuclease [Rhodococcus aetherivorans]|uniref:DNA/RNA non-specific endonuclease n=1 Tax=Rhodococcus aetherivorans TaxID=191292 RepID=UPI00294A258F|nr:DNA/RNA non-specific endonuclease [Rhodococcus aetherivorans]MDV6293471.1 hypothetical protein [Rhodococcus aetherivorans]